MRWFVNIRKGECEASRVHPAYNAMDCGEQRKERYAFAQQSLAMPNNVIFKADDDNDLYI